MDLNNVTFGWLSGLPEDWKINKVKHHFIFTKNKIKTIDGNPILSLTKRGVIERDISKNEGQLPESYEGYILLERDDIILIRWI